MTDIEFALKQLADLARIKPHSVTYLTGYEPERGDIQAFQNDLYLIAGKVDRVFEAYGRYLESLDLVTAQDVKDHFTNVTFNVIDGYATFAIENGISRRIEERVDA